MLLQVRVSRVWVSLAEIKFMANSNFYNIGFGSYLICLMA